MPVEVKDLLPLIGMEGSDPATLTVDTVRETMNKKFIDRAVAHEDPEVNKKAVGKRMGAVTTTIAQLFDKPHNDLNGKDVETILKEIKEGYTTQITDLTQKATAGNDKKLTDLTAELEDKKKSISAYEKVNKELKDELDKTKTESATQIKTMRMNDRMKEVESKIPFIDDITEAQRVGLKAIVSSKYDFDLDDKFEKIVVKDKLGNPVPSKLTVGSFADAEEILKTEAEANKLLKKNNGGGGTPGGIVVPKQGDDKSKTGYQQNNRKKDLLQRQKF